MEQYFSDAERQFVEQSLENPAIAAWLSNFAPETTSRFLLQYFRHRAHWLHVGAHELRRKHDWLTTYMVRAEKALFFIQQKKLFDLQCLWRAEQAEVPGVLHSAAFLDLEENIRSLDFLSPITADELQLLKDWLMDYKASQNMYPIEGWQHYDRFVHNNREQWCLPSLYRYMNLKTNTASLWRVLPDTRGQKEEVYSRASRQARYPKKDDDRAEGEPTAPIDPRPRLYGDDREYAKFATAFEDHRTNEYRQAYEDMRVIGDDHELDMAIETLQHAEGPVAMEAHENWSDAIIYAAWKYERKQLMACLDVAYENYCFRLQMGIGFAKEADDEPNGQQMSESESWANEILDGRELLGEPRDFDF